MPESVPADFLGDAGPSCCRLDVVPHYGSEPERLPTLLPMTDEGLRQAAAANPRDKFELVFKHLLESLFVERMDQNEEIFVRYMNDAAFQKVVTSWLAAEAYKRLHEEQAG